MLRTRASNVLARSRWTQSSTSLASRFVKRRGLPVVHAAKQAPIANGKGKAAAGKAAKAQKAQKEEEATITLPLLNIDVPESIYTYLQVAVLLAQLALVDAAYSGDWSRIGVITTDTELLLQKVVIFIVVAHSVVAALTARLASEKGVDVPSSTIKGFLFGTMELVKVAQK